MAKAAPGRNGSGWRAPLAWSPCRTAEVTPDEIRARLAQGEDVFLLDVREPDEVEEWAYPIGVNIPLGQLGARVDELPRDTTIVVACAVGGRSAQAATALSDAGYTAENLTGGAVAWAATEPEPEPEPGNTARWASATRAAPATRSRGPNRPHPTQGLIPKLLPGTDVEHSPGTDGSQTIGYGTPHGARYEQP